MEIGEASPLERIKRREIEAIGDQLMEPHCTSFGQSHDENLGVVERSWAFCVGSSGKIALADKATRPLLSQEIPGRVANGFEALCRGIRVGGFTETAGARQSIK
jgi:hypothetical protein